MNRLAPYLKALVAGAIAALGVLITALDYSTTLTARDYLSASVAFLAALGAVFAVPNKPS